MPVPEVGNSTYTRLLEEENMSVSNYSKMLCKRCEYIIYSLKNDLFRSSTPFCFLSQENEEAEFERRRREAEEILMQKRQKIERRGKRKKQFK